MPTATPARTPKSKKTFDDIALVSEDDETFTARIFGDSDPFTFSKDVNGYLQLGAYSGEPGTFKEFMLSMLEVEVPDDVDVTDEDKMNELRADTKRRFEDLMKAQKGLTIARLIKFSLDITEIAGNEATK